MNLKYQNKILMKNKTHPNKEKVKKQSIGLYLKVIVLFSKY